MPATATRSITALLDREIQASGAAALAPAAASTTVEAPPSRRPSPRPVRADELDLSGGE